MNARVRFVRFVRTAVAAALAVPALTALAQTVQLHTLVSPSMRSNGKDYICSLTNVSNQSVTVTKLEIVDNGSVWSGASSCGGALAAGQRCSVQGPDSSPASGQPYCRAQYLGTEGAAVGSFYANYMNQIGSGYGAVVAVPMQAVKNVILATAN